VILTEIGLTSLAFSSGQDELLPEGTTVKPDEMVPEKSWLCLTTPDGVRREAPVALGMKAAKAREAVRWLTS